MEKISEKLREAVEAAIKSGKETRYSIAKNARVNVAALYRWLDEGRDIRLSTVDSLAEYLGLTLSPIPAPKSRKADA